MQVERRSRMLPVLLLSVAAITITGQAVAAPEVVPVEGVSYNVNASLADNLRALSGKRVTVTLDSGATMSGIVGAVGQHLLHLERLDRKEYFDAAVRIDAIRAIETRFRQIKR